VAGLFGETERPMADMGADLQDDTTLRDGCQAEDITFTLEDKLRIYFRDKALESDFRLLETQLPGRTVNLGSRTADETEGKPHPRMLRELMVELAPLVRAFSCGPRVLAQPRAEELPELLDHTRKQEIHRA